MICSFIWWWFFKSNESRHQFQISISGQILKLMPIPAKVLLADMEPTTKVPRQKTSRKGGYCLPSWNSTLNEQKTMWLLALLWKISFKFRQSFSDLSLVVVWCTVLYSTVQYILFTARWDIFSILLFLIFILDVVIIIYHPINFLKHRHNNI